MRIGFNKAVETILVPKYAGLWLDRWYAYEGMTDGPNDFVVFEFCVAFDCIQQIYNKTDEQIIAALKKHYNKDGEDYFDVTDVEYALNTVRKDDNEA